MVTRSIRYCGAQLREVMQRKNVKHGCPSERCPSFTATSSYETWSRNTNDAFSSTESKISSQRIHTALMGIQNSAAALLPASCGVSGSRTVAPMSPFSYPCRGFASNVQMETSGGSAMQIITAPSLEEFRARFYDPEVPVVIRGAMEHWPARHWTPQSLRERFGAHEVPVELARWHPQERRWGDYRDLYREHTPRSGVTGRHAGGDAYFVPRVPMLLENFVDLFIDPPEGAPAGLNETEPPGDAVRGHLAQHQLLQELPDMAADVIDPEYVAVGRGVYQRNIWLGPRDTTTPLHRDPYHNILAQIWGSKLVRLYAPDQTNWLHPFTTSLLLRNSSQVDVEAPDATTHWPGFSAARYWECHLAAGEMLYIPTKWWHYIRAKETSLSISFWWT